MSDFIKGVASNFKKGGDGPFGQFLRKILGREPMNSPYSGLSYVDSGRKAPIKEDREVYNNVRNDIYGKKVPEGVDEATYRKLLKQVPDGMTAEDWRGMVDVMLTESRY